MADPTKADLAGDLEKRVRALENTASKADGAITAARWFFGTSLLALVISAVNFYLTYFDVRATVAVQGSQIADAKVHHANLEKLVADKHANLEKLVADKTADGKEHLATSNTRAEKSVEGLESRLSKSIDKIENRFDKSVDKLDTRLANVERQAVHQYAQMLPPPPVTHEGTFVGLKDGKITIRRDGKESVFTFAKDAQLFLNQNPIKLEDFKPPAGAPVYFYLAPDDATVITAIATIVAKK
jgi:hypothetical protein